MNLPAIPVDTRHGPRRHLESLMFVTRRGRLASCTTSSATMDFILG